MYVNFFEPPVYSTINQEICSIAFVEERQAIIYTLNFNDIHPKGVKMLRK